MNRTNNSCRPAKLVLKRLLGQRSDDFQFTQIPTENGRDVFDIKAHNGTVHISGSSPVAITRGAYEYLRRACNCHVAWEGIRLELPTRLPDFARQRVVCPHRYRHSYNVCTFAYTMVWWDWARWEREIDWLALHGVNMPLSLLGQSAIWQRVWKSFGFSDEDVQSFFNGPAFLPWSWMGNHRGHAVPLPQHWIDTSRELQKRIMQRELELGMTPVTPGFAGFVPSAFTGLYPKARLIPTASKGYTEQASLVLDPRDPMFAKIGKHFVQEYTKEYGTAHMYLADTFNEITPPFAGPSKNEELASVCQAVYEAIRAGDPEGALVLQGWTFGYDSEYWPNDAVEAYVSRVPVDKLLFLDLHCDKKGNWERNPYFRQRQWIFCILHNFGQSTPMYGDLERYAGRLGRVVKNPDRGLLVGAGFTPEGIEQNAAVYELLTDAMWLDESVNLPEWIRHYCQCRYGQCPERMTQAWDILCRTVYKQAKTPLPVYLKRPHLEVRGGYKGHIPYDTRELIEAVNLFLDCPGTLTQSGLYHRDLVDLLKQHLANVADQIVQTIVQAYRRKDRTLFDKETERFLALLRDIDDLLSTRPEYRLSRWINAARGHAAHKADADHYEYNARLQITRWGGPRTVTDYANKEWSGLVRHYYIPRWKLFFEELRRTIEDGSFDQERWHNFMDQWEWEFASKTELLEEEPASDPIGLARELLNRYVLD